MKKLICTLLVFLALVPLASEGEAAVLATYHEIFESMKMENATLSWEQLKEATDGGDTFHEFPELNLKLYDPLGNMTVDEEHGLYPSFKRHYGQTGLTFSDKGRTIQFVDHDNIVKFIINEITNPEIDASNVPLDETRVSSGSYFYFENTLSINGLSCPITCFISPNYDLKTFTLVALLRTSDDCVLFIRGTFSKFGDRAFEEIESEFPFYENVASYLLAFCPLDSSSSETAGADENTSENLGPVLVSWGNADSLSGDIFTIYEPEDGVTLALLEGGECLVDGYFNDARGDLDWEIHDEEGRTLASGHEKSISNIEIPLPNCFEAGHTYEMVMSSGGETHTLHMNVIEGNPDLYPRHDHLELISPAEGIPFVAKKPPFENDNDDFFEFRWNESGFGLVHILIEGNNHHEEHTLNPITDSTDNGVYFNKRHFEAGKTYTITLTQGTETIQREFTIAEAENPETGTVSAVNSEVGEKASDEKVTGAEYSVSSASAEGSSAGNGILAATEFETGHYKEGFMVPIPVGKVGDAEWEASNMAITQTDSGNTLSEFMNYSLKSPGSESSKMSIVYEVYPVVGFTSAMSQKLGLERRELANMQTLAGLTWTSNYTEVEGHPVLIMIGNGATGGTKISMAYIEYIRNNQLLQAMCLSLDETLKMNDLIGLAKRISFDESLAAFKESQVALTLSSENDERTITAGQKLKFTASFGDPEYVNAKAKNNKLRWIVGESYNIEDGTGRTTEYAKINNSGVLTAGSKIDDIQTVTVVVMSETYQTYDTMEITLLPKVTKVLTEPAEVSLFAVESAEEKVTVSLEPAVVPMAGLIWTPSAKNIVEVEDHGDGTATIRPLKAGKVTVTVKEKGGKTGKVAVQVKQPVQELELTSKGKAVPGKSLTVSAKISPSNATDKKLTWSLNVDESIATITGNGQVKISKDTPVGTKIMVTCVAEGAPQPVTATYEMEVVEK